MKRLTVAVAMMALATIAFAADEPDYGVYESTDAQYRNTGDGFEPMEGGVLFRLLYIPDNDYVGLVWDYDGDGLTDEDVEMYEHEMTEQGLVWQEGELVYALYQDDDGQHVLMMIFPDDTAYAIDVERIDYEIEKDNMAL